MRLLLSLDYELYFGRPSGSVDACLLEPTDALLRTVEPFGLMASLFVDAGYLLKLRELARKHRRMNRDYSQILRQLENAVRRGHDVQLHIHPHWEDTRFSEDEWQFDTRRYRLHDFRESDRADLVRRYKSILENISAQPVFAYRAGGWCLQPFSEIATALRLSGVWLDSTVFPGGFSQDRERGFDFRTVTSDQCWRFEEDPLAARPDGYFLEVPISVITTGPALYWRMAAARLTNRPNTRAMGDGHPMEHDHSYYLARLLKRTTAPASIDGMKAAYVKSLLQRKTTGDLVNVMGHPKSLSRRSLQDLKDAVTSVGSVSGVTYQSFLELAPRSIG